MQLAYTLMYTENTVRLAYAAYGPTPTAQDSLERIDSPVYAAYALLRLPEAVPGLL